jgi:hypothetical protein
MSGRSAQQEALHLAKFVKGHIGPHAPGTRLIDTLSEEAVAFVVAMFEQAAIVVYEDRPHEYVSVGNEPGRWVA